MQNLNDYTGYWGVFNKNKGRFILGIQEIGNYQAERMVKVIAGERALEANKHWCLRRIKFKHADMFPYELKVKKEFDRRGKRARNL